MNRDELLGSLPQRLLRIAEDIRKAGGESIIVGGWVRDAMLGHPSRDYDIEVYGLGQEALLDVLKKHGKPNLVGKSYGVIHLASKGLHFDFSFPRLESKVGAGHRAFAIETRPDLDFYTAALRRDFTMNAMGMSLPSLELVDPHGGLKDLQAKVLRHVSPAFAEDPLRVLRAVQFAARFQLTIHPDTIELCRTLDLRELSRERYYEEFRKWLNQSKTPSFGLQAFQQLELKKFFPWIAPANQQGWDRLGLLLDKAVCESFDSEMDRMVFLYSVLCNDCDSTQSVVAFLESLTNEVQILRQVPILFKEGPSLADAIADGRAFHAPFLRRQALRFPLPQTVAWVRIHWLVDECVKLDKLMELEKLACDLDVWDKAPQPFLTGKMLMDLGQKPGKHFGEWIAECFELQLDGLIRDVSDAEKWAKQKITASGTS